MKKEHCYFVYIMTNKLHSVLYIGVTGDIRGRVWEHRNGEGSLFAWKYRCFKLVYVEDFSDVNEAIQREKVLKGWRREKKNLLITGANPEWKELAPKDDPWF